MPDPQHPVPLHPSASGHPGASGQLGASGQPDPSGPAPLLNPAAINAALAGTVFSGQVQHFATVDSTSTLALEAAQKGMTRGVWVADEQTAGRGRGGHTWHSAHGDGLYVSALLTPDLPLAHALWLSLAAGLAAQAAVQQTCGLTLDLRWPNDLMLGIRKCGGILVETAVAPTSPGTDPRLRHAVIGIGINVRHHAFPRELQDLATSLHLAGAPAVDRQALLIALLRALDRELLALDAEHHNLAAHPAPATGILDRFVAASSWPRGKRVHVPESGGYTGTTAGLDSRGFLIVDADDGTRRTVLSGGVRELP